MARSTPIGDKLASDLDTGFLPAFPLAKLDALIDAFLP